MAAQLAWDAYMHSDIDVKVKMEAEAKGMKRQIEALVLQLRAVGLEPELLEFSEAAEPDQDERDTGDHGETQESKGDEEEVFSSSSEGGGSSSVGYEDD